MRGPTGLLLLAGLILLARPAPLPGAPPASGKDPGFTILWETAVGKEGEAVHYTTQVRSRYALVASRDGSYKFDPRASSSVDLYRLRGGFFGLKPGERLNFYVVEESASGTAVDAGFPPCTGAHTITPDGWIHPSTDGKPGSPWDFGRVITATLDRTSDGAILSFQPRCVAGDCEFLTCDLSGWPKGQARMGEFRFTGEELKNFGGAMKRNAGTVVLDDGLGSVEVKASLNPRPVESEEAEIVVTPEKGYDKWVPEGTLSNPEEPGKRLTATVTVQKPDDPKTPRKARLTFTLVGVSREKGVCMNRPRGDQAKTANGLRFRQQDQPDGGLVTVTDETRAETRDDVERVDIVLSSFDFGAWGTLSVSGKDRDGKALKVKVKVRGEERPQLDVPLDDNTNRIADGWEREKGVEGQRADQDEETEPPGKPGVLGDGLTLYEEYRGFSVGGAHVRGDPKKKDLFVCDDTSGHVAGPGIDLFEKVTGLKVHRVKQYELGDDRIVNVNGSGVTHAVDQHGILVVDGPKSKSPEQIPMDPDVDLWGPPGLTRWILWPFGDGASKDSAALLAHELGHAVGISHHGEALTPVVWSFESDGELYEQPLDADSDSATQGRTGSVTRIEAFWESPFRRFVKGDGAFPGSVWDPSLNGWKLFVAGRHGECSGRTECIMRYDDRGVYVPFEGKNVRYIPDPSQWRARDSLCSDQTGTGVNAPDHPPVSRYGDAAVGNCKGQVVVNDRYVPPKRLAPGGNVKPLSN